MEGSNHSNAFRFVLGPTKRVSLPLIASNNARWRAFPASPLSENPAANTTTYFAPIATAL